MKLELQQSLQLQMTQELIQAIELLQLNALEMDLLMQREAEENVMLELEEKENEKLDYFIDTYKKNRFQSQKEPTGEDEKEDRPDQLATESFALKDFLLEQLYDLPLSEEDQKNMVYLIDNVDERGYLQTSLPELAKGLGMETHEVYPYLKILWTFEPRGIGARDLRECLMLQLDGEDENLVAIVDLFLEELGKNQLTKIAKALNLTPTEVQEYGDQIKKLNPKPASGYHTGDRTHYIIPEIFVHRKEDELDIEILDSLHHQIHLNSYYLRLLKRKDDEQTVRYLREKYKRALFLLESIEKRRQSIEKVVHAIVKAQEDFFMEGKALNPLTLADVAQTCDLSESTVSRVSRSKYLQCSQGVFPLKHFFVQGLDQGRKAVSKDYIQIRMQELIQGEDPKKPLSDQSLANIMEQEGIGIKRRTVAKYRDELNIPAASKRRRY